MPDYKSSRYKIVTVECIIRIIKKLPQKRYYNPLYKKKINTIRSLPMWECGLKQLTRADIADGAVTPHVGVWIETKGAYP